MLKFIATLVLVLGLSLGALGCACAEEDKTLIKTGAAVGDGDLRDWPNLTDEQKWEAHWKQTRVLHVLDKTHNKRELPAPFDQAQAPAAPAPAPKKAPTDGK